MNQIEKVKEKYIEDLKSYDRYMKHKIPGVPKPPYEEKEVPEWYP